MAAEDKFYRSLTLLNSPAESAFAITPSDTDELDAITRAIYVGGAGDVEVVTMSRDTVIFKDVPVGTTLAVRARQVKAANTDATNLVGLY